LTDQHGVKSSENLAPPLLPPTPPPAISATSSVTPDSSGVVSFGDTQIHRAPTGA